MITREIKGIEPLTSRTQSENSTTELNLPSDSKRYRLESFSILYQRVENDSTARCEIRTHADSRPGDLKSPSLGQLGQTRISCQKPSPPPQPIITVPL